ncbi:hypothetical protein [Polyangium sp. 6x1]|uniref:hypothetical protein n=1 Tax=Polyangium sp. 6x1 TaxID=3042689 RepID=UPI00248266D4|nr:hypothetical protein [Polyangium sp. 6x1]MDI1448735.1 hypothetical protein [Polyangium sp. 6x1]
MTTRFASFVVVSATMAAIQSHASTARAASPDKAYLQVGPGAPLQGAGTRDDSWRLKVSGSLGGGFTLRASMDDGHGPGAFAGSFRVLGGWEPTPAFFCGFSYRGVRGRGNDDGFGASIDTDIVTSVFEFHPTAGFWADPYVSVDLGYGFYSSDVLGRSPIVTRFNGFAAGVGLGFAFRSKRVAFGPQLSFVTLPSVGSHSALLDLRLDVRF